MPKALAVLCILFVFAFSGCSGTRGGNSQTPPPQNQATMQAGQWEFTIASANGNPNVFAEADVTTAPMGGSLSSSTGTALFWPQTGGQIAGLYDDCVGLQATFSISGNTVTALLFPATAPNPVAQATATLSTDTKSMTGTFQLSGVTALCGAPVSASGTFTGQVIAPLNGTYKGALSDGSQLTIQVAQDSSFNISASGTSILNGVTTSLTIGANTRAGYNNVIGATVSSDNGTASNVNGSGTFQVFGHFSPDASQISFASNNGQWTTGTLTKQ
jgi:hypothetical protein